ncbi:hypothetical protein CH294_10525 [Rhodococcus sp. 14-2483-1-1]|nr:hypothetical protein CH294_10525 [Rhodococcus sp. 14-2483-1-1]
MCRTGFRSLRPRLLGRGRARRPGDRPAVAPNELGAFRYLTRWDGEAACRTLGVVLARPSLGWRLAGSIPARRRRLLGGRLSEGPLAGWSMAGGLLAGGLLAGPVGARRLLVR